jgi:transcriptional regulator with XRE-family HTH domain
VAWSTSNIKRTYACNPDLLSYLRECRGWTQSQLAQVSGYTPRLISKAESGRTISAATVEVLAEALSTPEQPVYPEDLVFDPIARAKEYIRALYTHQQNALPHIRHFLDDEVVYKIAGDPAAIPFAGEHRGIEAVQRALDIFFSILEVPENHDPDPWYRYMGQGNEVIIWGESWIHPIGSPLTEPIGVTIRLEFRKGKMVLFDDRFDTQAGEACLRATRPSS